MGRVEKPSNLCLTCRDCDGRGYTSPDNCKRCGGMGWLPFNTRCDAERVFDGDGYRWTARCNLEPWHEGEHAERLTVNRGTFYDPIYRTSERRWPSKEYDQNSSQEKP